MSDQPVAAKLLIKPGDTVWLSDAGAGTLLGPLPGRRRSLAEPSGATATATGWRW